MSGWHFSVAPFRLGVDHSIFIRYYEDVRSNDFLKVAEATSSLGATRGVNQDAITEERLHASDLRMLKLVVGQGDSEKYWLRSKPVGEKWSKQAPKSTARTDLRVDETKPQRNPSSPNKSKSKRSVKAAVNKVTDTLVEETARVTTFAIRMLSFVLVEALFEGTLLWAERLANIDPIDWLHQTIFWGGVIVFLIYMGHTHLPEAFTKIMETYFDIKEKKLDLTKEYEKAVKRDKINHGNDATSIGGNE